MTCITFATSTYNTVQTHPVPWLRASAPCALRTSSHGGDGGFDRVFDICHASCQGLLDHITAHHELD